LVNAIALENIDMGLVGTMPATIAISKNLGIEFMGF
jgi:ABC-type taurine transport system substrate-binding protein